MAHGFLSYQDTRGEVDYLGMIGRAIRDRLKKTGKKDKKGSGDVELKDTPEGVEPVKTPSAEEGQKSLLGSGPKGLLKGSTLSKLSGTSPRALGAGAAAVTPEVMGGALSRFSRKPGIDAGSDVYDTTATRVVDPAGSLQGIGELIVRSNNNLIEAVMGVQRVTVRVVDSVENLGRLQAAIADKQMQQQMLLATRAEVAAEKNLLAAGSDKSGQLGYDPLTDKPIEKGGGFLQLPGLGGIPRLPAGRRGGALARRVGTRAATRAATKAGTKGAAKIGAKALGKGLLKKIPFLGLGAGLLFGAERAMAGDWKGAGLEVASGGASMIPGFGTAASVGIDAALAGRDMGLTPFAEGGIITKPTASLMGEAGKEGVFPLEGSKGKKTFLQFGEGILEAQKRNKRENAKLMALGLQEYYEKKSGWQRFLEALGDFIKSTPLGKFFNWGGKDDGSNDSPGRRGPGGKVGNDLFSTISGGEGGVDSYNTGTAGSQAGYTPPKPISQMTVGEIMDAQASGSLFAVGKYQIIPDTMKGFVKHAGISRDDIFNEATQDKFKEYVVNIKRPDVGKFLTGAEGSSLEKAQMALAAEFASVGVPRDMKKGEYGGGYPVRDIKKGESLYSGVGGNAASISPEVIAEALQKEMGLNRGGGNTDNPDLDLGESKPSWTEAIPYPTGLQPGHSGALKIADGIFARVTGNPQQGGRWQIYKQNWGGPDKGEISTAGDDNASLEPLLRKRIEEYEKQRGGGAQANAASVSPPPSGPDVAVKSSEIAMATTSGTTIINNNTYVTGSSGPNGNQPGDVPFGIGSRDTGTSPFAQIGIMSIG